MGQAISQMTQVVPAGMVCFFVSYSYMDQVVKVWKESGMWNEISKSKTLFVEPKQTNLSDQVLKQYEKLILVEKKVSQTVEISEGCKAYLMSRVPFFWLLSEAK
jgi:Rad3-related DNA helicase